MDQAVRGPDRFLVGGGEMGALLRGHDWSTSPLGDPSHWPEPIKTMVELLIHSKQPMFLASGPELSLLYNDAYIPICGQRHPGVLARPMRLSWPEAWDCVEPLLRRALAGEAVLVEDSHFLLQRNGVPEETWFNFSYSPVHDDGGTVGVLCIVTETTQHVLERRRAALQTKVADELRTMKDDLHIKARVAALLGRHLGANCVGYASVDESGEYAVAETEWTDGTFAGAKGRRHRLKDYGEGYWHHLRSGRIARVNDVLTDDLTASAAQSYADLPARALINAPIVRHGRLDSVLYVLDSEPRVWSDAEERVVQQVAERTVKAMERVCTERSLTLLAEQRQLALDAADLGWWTYDIAAGQCTYDRRLREMYGIADATGSVHEATKLIHPDDVALVWELIDRALDPSSGGSFNATFRVQRLDGKTLWVEARGVAAFDAEGPARRAVQLVGTVADITARRHAEEAVKLEGRRKDDFLAVLGHELRNPMGAISNALAVLQRAMQKEPLAPLHARQVNVMDRQLRQLTRLVDDLLDVSRIRTGKLKLQIDPVAPLAEIVQSAIEACQPLIEARRHRLEVSIPSEPILIPADPSRLSQVLANLINNAAKYTPEQGRIALTVSRSDNQAVIEVTDTGIGIDPQDVQRAFDLFTQVHDAGAGAQGGLGVGLALARTIVNEHGGSIRITSAGRAGCTVRVSLPVHVQVLQHP